MNSRMVSHYVLIISAKAVYPPNHKHIAGSQLVEQTPTFRALDKARVQTRYAVIGDHLIYGKPCRLGVSELVLDGLLCSGYITFLSKPALRHFFGQQVRRATWATFF
jgi:hypothetical protein